jgi:primosomal protein N' (replication factor Y) (superfamily II helicase)
VTKETFFVDVVVPLAVPNLFTYRLPFGWEEGIKPGIRVVVPFGFKTNRLYTALVRKVHQVPPKIYEAKYIEAILDEEPVVTENQFQLWDWLASYYMCHIGDVMNAALPSGLKLSSETRVLLSPEFDKKYENLTDKEFLIVEALELNQVLSINDICNIAEQKTVYPLIRSLLDKGAIVVEEEVKEKFRPKLESFVKLRVLGDKEKYLKELFEKLEKKAPKQADVLLAYVKLSGGFSSVGTEVKKADLLKFVEGADGAISGLAKKGILEVYTKETLRIESIGEDGGNFKKLNEGQQAAFEEIKDYFQQKDVVLLHGVTGSGKTEIYISLIEEMILQGRQVLYLLPEIALTTQIINRLRNSFGDRVGVYHSKYNENERVEVWNKMLGLKGQEKYAVVLGARSALFLPFDNLGLIIVDEEHETSFKQFDPAPRYHARDSALWLSRLFGAKTLLGSATPSIESYYNATSGKYGLVELAKRHGGAQLPEILVADLKEATRKKLMKSHYSPMLLDHIKESLESGEQVILFQNRRGFSPQIHCKMCGWMPECTRCDVTLTYHKQVNLMKCHYCGFSHKVPKECGACGSPEIETQGFGTEKIEDELSIFFPGKKIARMDLDTTRAKNAYKQIIEDFEEKRIDILVGTQMVTKGLDFDNVGLVGILSADSMLKFPDFRANERSYQLMAQVSGRAGRKQKRGKVVIQSFDAIHPIIKDVIENNYLSMYSKEMMERKNFHYPPFYRLIEFTLQHKELDIINEGAKEFANSLREMFGNRVLGPEFPAIARIKNLYQKKVIIKVEREGSINQVKAGIRNLMGSFSQHKDWKSIRIVVDVDPI